MTQSDYLRLQRIVVDDLFDTYNHDINLNLKDRVTLLHGPTAWARLSSSNDQRSATRTFRIFPRDPILTILIGIPRW